jgi:transcriptional regulator with XRE-family HTH domain
MDDWRQIVGVNIRRLRVANGLSQERLAFESEIDLTYLGGIERGKRNPSLLVLARIAAALGAVPGELLRKTPRRGRKA